MFKAVEYFAALTSIKSLPFPSVVGVRWHPPPQGWLKLSSDGSALSNPGKAGAGVVIRDINGEWVAGFYRHIPWATSVEAEL
ncbi:hypothetical protein GOBAR_DD06405 [Gossypium barbadense]|nr:hypothetical protein GOBAR_DD06405 [Gossypium barbadense]